MSVEALLNGALLGGLYAVVALGLSLVFGIMRLVNLAHGILVLAGAYFAIVITEYAAVDPFLSLLIIVPVTFVVAYATQRLLLSRLLSRSVEAPLVATFGLLILGQGILTQVFGGQARSITADVGNSGFDVFGLRVRTIYVIAFVLAVVITVATQWVMTRTRFGVALRASAADPATASTLGINITRMHAITFGIASCFAAVAGLLWGTAFSVTPVGGLPILVLAFTVVVLGGVGSVTGTLVGGVIVGLTEAIGGALWAPTYAAMCVYLLLLLMLVVRPTGLFTRRHA